MTTSWFLKIALPTPLRRTFDYLPPENGLIEQLQIGQRILVPFGRSRLTGILLEKTTHSDIAKEKLKQVICALDEQSIIPDTLLPWFKRIADYYHHSLGEVLFTALPPDAKRDKSLLSYEIQWQVCNTDFETSQSLQRSPKQAALFECIKNRKGPVGLAELDSFKDPLRLLNELENKGVIARSERLNTQIKNKLTHRIGTTPVLTSAQRAALHEIKAHLQHFQCFLLKGITGSGKTEVYLQLIEQVIEQGKQALLLAPEIGLTPQLFLRVQQRFENHLGVMHSNMSAGDRKRLWQRILEGDVNILVGTRSAVFAPLPKLGLIVIDEEHDLSYKQQDGFRYSARDIALMRAQGENIPVILGSATPSLESLKNAENKRYTLIELPDRAGVAKAPKTHLIDMRNQDRHFAVSASLIEKIKHALQREEQALLFLNRRGFSPVLICQDCGHVNRCRACDYPQTYHQAERLLRCHQCTRAEAVPTQCAACGNHQLQPLGFGTERVMEQLSEAFPGTEILRIDRDTTRKRGAFEEILQQIEKPGPKILLGTQMIAKGHDFPNLTLVGVIDADQGLFGADFRSTERLAQL
ncbi:MAG: primosomal protein N', partial [Gammaproteobacteria bacterium]|nr:primosomal protein N' [Gammaproteobacteria bacterium]